MLTRSGALVLPGNSAAPSIRDIARGLGRIPRFAGQTRGWWSVLHHAFVVEYLVMEWWCEHFPVGGRNGPPVPVPVRLYALLHDAHEAVTGDIPTTWKRERNREDQDRLDARIYAKLDVPFPSAAVRQLVKECDRQALIVEADALGPREFFEAEPELRAARAEALTPERVHIVHCLQEWNPPSATIEDRGALVTAYEALVERLVIACSR